MTFAGGVVSLVQDPSGSSFVEPDAGYAQIGDITSRGRLLAVSRLGWGAGEIQRITADGGVSRLLELAGVNAVALATDDSRLVWVKAAGDAAAMFDGYYGTASIAWATFDGSSLGPIIEGPVLSAAPSVYRSLKIGGDYAATVGCPAVSGAETEPACTLYVVQLSTQKLFVVPPRSENNDFVSVLGVSDAEIVVAEEDYPRRPPFGLIERIVRLSTASLDSLFR